MYIESRAMKIVDRMEVLEREMHQSELNGRLGWEYDIMKEEKIELESELIELGY